MKYARIRVTGAESTPVTSLAAKEGVETVHLLAGGVEDTDTPTYSLSIAGGEAAVRSVLTDDPDVIEWAVAGAEAGSVYAYVRFRAPPAVGQLRERLTRGSLVVLLPATFRAEGVELTVVGPPSELSDAFEGLPERLSATVLEVGTYRGGRLHRGSSLTDRQREVLTAAYELGYYERPRRASQEAIAAELGLAPSTVGEHLRKGERRLIADLVE
ncbi:MULTISPECIES: helix-turn-helix domain-containing protein [Saliphagus]|uniref:Helix-turn-helix domain-containing protein n=1 Tax=Saliphagus infecundisoli TaxID=1849069 RepID=A0ABD5QKA4_9EURY|nr:MULTISPECIES: helix-turn-helix domain-containing protein [Saliphagus]